MLCSMQMTHHAMLGRMSVRCGGITSSGVQYRSSSDPCLMAYMAGFGMSLYNSESLLADVSLGPRSAEFHS